MCSVLPNHISAFMFRKINLGVERFTKSYFSIYVLQYECAALGMDHVFQYSWYLFKQLSYFNIGVCFFRDIFFQYKCETNLKYAFQNERRSRSVHVFRSGCRAFYRIIFQHSCFAICVCSIGHAWIMFSNIRELFNQPSYF